MLQHNDYRQRVRHYLIVRFLSIKCSHNCTSHLFGEPLLCLVSGDSLEFSEFACGVLSLGDSLSGSSENDVEVHTEDTSGDIILDTKIDVLINTEAEVSFSGEVALSELVLLDSESLLEELFGTGTSDSDVNGNLFVSLDGETSDGVSCLGLDWLLSS